MACGCNKSRRSSNVPRPAPMQPRQSITSQKQSMPLPQPFGNLSQERLRVEKLRREAIKRSLNK